IDRTVVRLRNAVAEQLPTRQIRTSRLSEQLRQSPCPPHGLSVLAPPPPPAVSARRPTPPPVPRGGGPAANRGPDADIPHLSAELITKYVGDLRLHGLIA
uniref:hypothetical protein n=1 Tax=Nocardia cyriacigeorgica TaxID=135487 RepID=UPI0024567BAE